ncbi:hypothetical protein M0812_21934 [Anaeramoeba flamelloides]|uniref:Dystroglycan-type cadherin-like domain-containing protein n=1 Tax=Anaeramoeba flamelloides TaxID=1746091 RepID=A0AAV7YT55_9EUKA|nr:hypothetical protein M0812_21934 [Anaeramoeba flamelloides]
MKILIFLSLFLSFYLISCSDHCVLKSKELPLGVVDPQTYDYVEYLEDGIRVISYRDSSDYEYYVQTLDSDGLRGEPVCYSCSLKKNIEGSSITHTGGSTFFISFLVHNYDNDGNTGVAGQLLTAKADGGIDLIGDVVALSNQWENCSKSWNKASWCETTKYLTVSFTSNDLGSVGVQMVNLGRYYTTPTLEGGTFTIKNEDGYYDYTKYAGISCDGVNGKLFVSTENRVSGKQSTNILGQLFDISDYDGEFPQIGEDFVIFNGSSSTKDSEPSSLYVEDQIYVTVFHSDFDEALDIYVQAVDCSNDFRTPSLFGDLFKVNLNEKADTYHYDSVAHLGGSTFAIAFSDDWDDGKSDMGLQTTYYKSYYRIYQVNEAKDNLEVLTEPTKINSESVDRDFPNVCLIGSNRIDYFDYSEESGSIKIHEYQVYWRIENPTVNQIEEFTVDGETDFDLDLSGAFTTSQGGTFSYELTLEDGSDLPDWFKYDDDNYHLSGTPPNEGIKYTILIIATEDLGSECSQLSPTNQQTFTFAVTEIKSYGSNDSVLMKVSSLLMFLVLFITF